MSAFLSADWTAALASEGPAHSCVAGCVWCRKRDLYYSASGCKQARGHRRTSEVSLFLVARISRWLKIMTPPIQAENTNIGERQSLRNSPIKMFTDQSYNNQTCYQNVSWTTAEKKKLNMLSIWGQAHSRWPPWQSNPRKPKNGSNSHQFWRHSLKYDVINSAHVIFVHTALAVTVGDSLFFFVCQ